MLDQKKNPFSSNVPPEPLLTAWSHIRGKEEMLLTKEADTFFVGSNRWTGSWHTKRKCIA
jgi:hypothetical protein